MMDGRYIKAHSKGYPPQATRIAMSLALLFLGVYGLYIEEGMLAVGGYKEGKD
jgi:hypothetical protein